MDDWYCHWLGSGTELERRVADATSAALLDADGRVAQAQSAADRRIAEAEAKQEVPTFPPPTTAVRARK
eukprot:COSAG05_NODE_6774_length_905_cov_1.258065_2_plen_69_part_00